MKPLSLLGKVLLIGLLIALASPAYGQPLDQIPQESGFSGFVLPGVAFWRVEDNMVARISYFSLTDRKINSINDSPKSEYSVTPMLTFNLRYTFASTRTQVFLGNQLEDLLRFDLATLLGVRQELADQSIIGLSYIFNPVVTQVWKDPYVENRNRSRTDRNVNGVRLTYDRILGSGAKFQYTFRNIDIDDEDSGSNPALGLTSSQADRLDRNGNQHDLEFLYSVIIEGQGTRHRFIPGVKYSRFDLDGEAMSFNYFALNFNYRYDVEKFAVAANGYYGYADYDKKNPIYGKTRDDDRYGFGVLGFYKHILGVRDLHLNVNLSINRGDSNIDFYDREIDVLTLGVFYGF